jgi:drug/metabolite transporter (DMT)-like permease
MSFYFFAWLALLFYGLEIITGKLTSKYKLKNPWQFSFFKVFFMSLLIVPIAIVNKGNVFPSDWSSLLTAAFFSSLGNVFLILSVFKLDVSVISPLFSFRTAFSLILSYILLDEILTHQQYFLVAAIFLAGLFVSMDEKFSFKSFFTPNVFIGILMTLFLALFSVFSNKSIGLNGYWTNMFWRGIASPLMMLLLLPLFYHDLLKTRIKLYLGAFLMSLFASVGILASLKAFESNVGISSAIISLPASMIMVYIISLLKPKLLEKHTQRVYLVRFLAAGVMFTCALLL